MNEEIDVYSKILHSNNIRSSGVEHEQTWDGKSSNIAIPSTFFENAVDLGGDIVEGAGNVVKGFAKGIPKGASSAGSEITDTFTNQWYSQVASPWMEENIPGLSSANKYINEALEIGDSTSEMVGDVIGNVTGQIILPGAVGTKALQGANIGSRILTNILGYGTTEALVIPAKDKGLIETGISMIYKDNKLANMVLESLEANEELPYFMQKLQRSPLLLLEGGVIGEGIAEAVSAVYKYAKNSPMSQSLKSGIKSKFQQWGIKRNIRE